ncbi:two-component system sensor histidine kinase DcuS [Bacillus aerolatus]|uniref:histidine kinase n=1 Tax=Bacillus aerolatus TaxID=2653354 RepID=A0A6I1FAU5_9BACI|nr:DcuS/MalK family sensor histidine kinase [Bacillus aerolatus]KAB7704169.1 two-component system sensor histidine kinase DcuS [Bacillus aerolatus]
MDEKIKGKITLQALIVMLVVLVVVSSLGVTNMLIASKVAESTRRSLAEKVTITSRLVAESAVVRDGLSGKGPEKAIQPFTEKIRKQSGTHYYITVFDMKGIRKSHPNPALIGKPFQGGDEGPVLAGEEHLSTAEGSLGVSIRYFTPVFDEEGRQTGAAAVGITLKQVETAVDQSRSIIYAGLAAGLVIGLSGALYLGRRVRRVMFGLEPHEMARLLEERSIMIESTHEGMVAVDRAGRITLINEAAARLLEKAGIHGPFTGKEAESVIPRFHLPAILEKGEAVVDEEVDVNGFVFYVNSSPLKVEGRVIGAISTFRDKTEVKKLAERLSGTEMYAEALRAQTHEFMNRLHVILGMVHMKNYDALAAYIEEINIRYQDSIGYLSRRIKDPVIAGFLLAKMSYSVEQGKEVVLSEDSYLPDKKDSRFTHELITILGNLIDNALEATPIDGRPVTVLIESEETGLTIEVKDHGKGMDSPDEAFTKGVSEKGKGRGFGLHLVNESVGLLGGTIQVLTEKGKGTIIEVVIPLHGKGENK